MRASNKWTLSNQYCSLTVDRLRTKSRGIIEQAASELIASSGYVIEAQLDYKLPLRNR